jgi:ABC-type phosphate transport system substrate-binding protein
VKKQFIGAAAALGVLASLVIAAPAAHAEPVCDGFAVVGSDTIQDVLTGIANGTNVTGYNVRASGNGKVACNFNAIDPVYLAHSEKSFIQTKAFGHSFLRPNGSGNGQIALSRSIDGGSISSSRSLSIVDQVDIARSSSAPSGSIDPTVGNLATTLAAYPFARDAISFATNASGLTQLTQQQLTSLFTCTNLGPNKLPQVNGVEYTPVLPQEGSGTREFFAKQIGLSVDGKITDANLPKGGEPTTCIKIGQEHQTSSLYNGNPMPANAVVVHSVAQWVAQVNGVGADRRGAGFTLGSAIAGKVPVDTVAGKLVPNASYYADTVFGRDTFLITQASRTYPGSSTFDNSLAALLGVSKAAGYTTEDIPGSSLLNQSTDPDTVGGVKLAYGFFPQTVKDAIDEAIYAPLKSGNLGAF